MNQHDNPNDDTLLADDLDLDLVIEDLEERVNPVEIHGVCVCSTSCKCTSCTCIAWAA